MSSRNNLGEMMQKAGKLAKAQSLFEENLQSDEISKDAWGAAVSRLNLGILAIEQGDSLRSEKLLFEALRVFRRLRDDDASTECLESLAGAAGARGESSRAATLFGAAEAAREEPGVPIRPVDRERYERFVAHSRHGQDERSWASAWSRGRTLSLQQAIDQALSFECAPVEGMTTSGPGSERPSTPLTAREREVAHLIAQGCTNRLISEKLSISERTVSTHVGRILKKLELRSRSQLAAWVAEQRKPASDQT